MRFDLLDLIVVVLIAFGLGVTLRGPVADTLWRMSQGLSRTDKEG